MWQTKNGKIAAVAMSMIGILLITIIALAAASSAPAVVTPFVNPIATPVANNWGSNSSEVLDSLAVPAEGYAYVLSASKHISVTSEVVDERHLMVFTLYKVDVQAEKLFVVKHDSSTSAGWAFGIANKGRYLLMDKAENTTILVVGKEPSTGPVQFQESLQELRDPTAEEMTTTVSASIPETKPTRDERINAFWKDIQRYQIQGTVTTALIDRDSTKLVGTWQGTWPKVSKDDRVDDCFWDSMDAAGITAGTIVFVALDRNYATQVLKDYKDLLGEDLELVPSLCK